MVDKLCDLFGRHFPLFIDSLKCWCAPLLFGKMVRQIGHWFDMVAM